MERADITPAVEAERLRDTDRLVGLAPEEWPVGELLLVATGRSAGLPGAVRGRCVDELAARL